MIGIGFLGIALLMLCGELAKLYMKIRTQDEIIRVLEESISEPEENPRDWDEIMRFTKI